MSSPRATYRVQLHPGFRFDDVRAIVDYLDELGVSHVYCSPYLQARAGSLHGYDVVDHHRISDELGGEAGHSRLVGALSQRGMGHVLDVVPNHMAVNEPANEWWWDVLKHGPASPYSAFFDIDWDPPEARLRRRVLLPVLRDHYGRVLEAGNIRIERSENELVVRHHDHVSPLSPESVEVTLGDAPGGEKLSALNSDPDSLHELLEKQHYRLAHWRTAGQDLNYRSFFAIADLAALRIENDDVFDAVHELVLELVDRGELDGLRIDHVDGLRDPAAYLRKLRGKAPNTYIVVEKILEPHEALPGGWPVEGTTGYDFLHLATGVLVDSASEKPLDDFYRDFTGQDEDLSDLRRAKKLMMMETELASDIERLTDLFVLVCELRHNYRDFTRHDMRETLRETLAAFSVYRTYVSLPSNVSPSDEVYTNEAVATAKERRDDLDPELFTFLGELLLMRHPGRPENELALRFQQTSGSVMAKGVEDTLFYAYNRFAALNEVGGDPGRFGVSVQEFHDAMERAGREHPRSMLATSTHDTKRSEDVRARLAVLSEVPERWIAAVRRWSALNERHHRAGMPDRNMEYLLYQTLVGAWPMNVERALGYMEKAAKEAKLHTSWIHPNEPYDQALRAFVEAALTDRAFVDDLVAFVSTLIEPGRINSLTQTLLKLTCPGIPDLYQGTELWDLSLVDPDNRRPVDYDARRALLGFVKQARPEEILARADEGAPKLFLVQRLLQLRRERPELFAPEAGFRPLHVEGRKAEHVVAFARGEDLVIVAPRVVLGLGDGWGATIVELGRGEWQSALNGDIYQSRSAMGPLLIDFPVNVLIRYTGRGGGS
jgi:(1->4)-alpha-D-glucan 1-alpha-D-glucosylmutase